MIKTILIATDFSLESLNILKKVLKEKNSRNEEIQYNILLVSGYDMGDSIRDLLFTTKGTVFNKIRSKEFCDAYAIIRNKYPHLINKILCDVFTGSFQRAFNNYLNAAQVEEAYYTTTLRDKSTKGKFDLMPYLKKAKDIKVQEVVVDVPEFMPERGRLAEVFVEV